MTTSFPIDPNHILSNPEHFVRSPIVFAAQWERLKEARGQTVDHERIGPSAHLIVSNTQSQAERIGMKVRQIASRKGYIEPFPPGVA